MIGKRGCSGSDGLYAGMTLVEYHEQYSPVLKKAWLVLAWSRHDYWLNDNAAGERSRMQSKVAGSETWHERPEMGEVEASTGCIKNR